MNNVRSKMDMSIFHHVQGSKIFSGIWTRVLKILFIYDRKIFDESTEKGFNSGVIRAAKDVEVNSDETIK